MSEKWEWGKNGETTAVWGHAIVLGEEKDKPAKAALISAAPEMLEALHLVGMSAGWQYLTFETQEIIQSAIDKAGGKK